MCDSSYETIRILLSLLIHALVSSHGLGQQQNCLSSCHTHHHMHLLKSLHGRTIKQSLQAISFP